MRKSEWDLIKITPAKIDRLLNDYRNELKRLRVVRLSADKKKQRYGELKEAYRKKSLEMLLMFFVSHNPLHYIRGNNKHPLAEMVYELSRMAYGSWSGFVEVHYPGLVDRIQDGNEKAGKCAKC